MSKVDDVEPDLSAQSKAILARMVDAFAVTDVSLMRRDETDFGLHLLSSNDSSKVDWTIYATLNVHEGTKARNGRSLNLELWGVSDDPNDGFDQVIVDAAAKVRGEGMDLEVGTIFPDFTADYAALAPNLPHVSFCASELFEELNYFKGDSGYIYCFQVLPISDAEWEFVRRTSFLSLIELFSSQKVQVADLNRESVDPVLLDAAAVRLNKSKYSD